MKSTLFLALFTAAVSRALDLTGASVAASFPEGSLEAKAVQLLREEIAVRTRILLPVRSSGEAGTTIRVRNRASGAPEGFRVSVAGNGVEIEGNDARGCIYGAGYFLRRLRWERDRLAIDDNLTHESSPRYPLRGHQMGYRPKTNSYDGWDLAQWERYIRDLVVFGMNAIELIPPRSDDAADSPHFPMPPMPMMAGVARIAASYGLEVWVWYPALDNNYADEAQIERAITEWTGVLKQLPRVDGIFVPGGDPGHTRPSVLFPFLGRMSAAVAKLHRNAKWYIGPHQFSPEWLDEFFAEMQKNPPWLSGIGFGPGGRLPLAEFKRRMPSRFEVRRYPDITHTRLAQYPVPDWDLALSTTAGREPINPRPRDMAVIHDHLAPLARGFIAYSEGCNDDVNKFVWLGKGWNPDQPVEETLRQYGNYFLGAKLGADFGQAILDLELNWRGPLATNGRVDQTLRKFQALESQASPAHLLNWRFQMALYRAYSDAFVQRRLWEEKARESRAREILESAQAADTVAAIDHATRVLEESVPSANGVLRRRIGELAEALFQSIRMQLSVSKYQAIGVMRGATLDTVDLPLANHHYWLAELSRLRSLPSGKDRQAGLRVALNRNAPGAGSYYDDLGDPSNQPHLVNELRYESDPGYMEGAYAGFHAPESLTSPLVRLPISTWSQAETLNGNPLRMRYEGLDGEALYRIRVIYGGYIGAAGTVPAKIRLRAEDRLVHDYLDRPAAGEALEFDIPPATTADGVLDLSFDADMRIRGPGRGMQVAEVWLLKVSGK